MLDPRLLNALDWAATLDGKPNVQAICSVRQLVSLVLQSIHSGPNASTAELLLWSLLWSTSSYCDALQHGPDDTDYWRDRRGAVLDTWRKDRVAAEMHAYGHVRATTLVALGAAETDPLAETAACDETGPSLLSAVTYQEAFERGWTEIPSQEPGHLAL
jgi:hypothetical protein